MTRKDRKLARERARAKKASRREAVKKAVKAEKAAPAKAKRTPKPTPAAEPPKRGPGRPPKIAGEKLCDPFSVRVSEGCSTRLRRRAEAEGITERQAAQNVLEAHA